MSKKFEREQKIVDRLERENRELKQKLRQLTNSIRRLSKGHKKLQEIEEPEELKREVRKVAEKICFECNLGTLQLQTILDKYYRSCNNCNYRTRAKNLKDLKKLWGKKI
ncbi:MAG: hypothetical protein HC836_46815 [Richelia sp. RM2_1_2]|nr:hypothetical protein [Richelia sp. RM2_1_2]